MWVIYINPNIDGETELAPIFYSFTDNKKYIKLFKEQRNMELYIIVKILDEDRANFNKIAKENPRRQLCCRPLLTKDENEKMTKVDVVMTDREDTDFFVVENKILIDVVEKPLFKIFDERMVWRQKYIFKEELNDAIRILWSKEISPKEVHVDQLALFISLHQFEMKGRKNGKI